MEAASCPRRRLVVDSGRAWLAGRGGLDAEILDQEAAIECGRLNFGALLTGPPCMWRAPLSGTVWTRPGRGRN